MEDIYVEANASIEAASQFLGTELALSGHARDVYELMMLAWEGGTESKTLTFVLITARGKTHEFLTRTANTSADMIATRPGIFVGPGDRVGVLTTGATAAMSAKAQLRRVGTKGEAR